MAYTKVKPLMVTSFPSSRLTGAFGAISGASLTGLGDGIDTKSASNDPAINTNPSAVGHTWLNKTSGAMFICTDATAGENVWVNVGSGIGDVWQFQGTIAGYTIGGATIDNIPSNGLNSIEKYAFASSGMSVVDQGDCSVVKGMSAGHTSPIHGYVTGGGPAAPSTSTNVIERHPYASASGTTDVGDLSRADNQHGGISGPSDGFIAAGHANNTSIGKFTYASTAVSTNIGNMSVQRYSVAGINSTTDGYVTGGYKNIAPTGVQTSTEKFSFSSGITTAHGSVSNIGSGFDGNGISSTTHGYAIGGYIIPSSPDVRSAHIDKFSFSSTANAASIGSISHITNTGGHWSNTTHGHYYGGRHTSFYTNIERFSYASDAVESSVGTLSSGRVYPSSSSN